ncbi:uncharacterized protein LOC112166918 isoform X2 [Rosa chinensis]|nr:uncharacterized protein LOC112166918 isoform X2 [Rosa chinensis]
MTHANTESIATEPSCFLEFLWTPKRSGPRYCGFQSILDTSIDFGTNLIWAPLHHQCHRRALITNSRGHGDTISFSPSDGNEKHRHGFAKKFGPLLSGTAYCISSCSMILLNKVVLSSYNFNAGVSFMFYQILISYFMKTSHHEEYLCVKISYQGIGIGAMLGDTTEWRKC